MITPSSLILLILYIVSFVAAHGFVSEVTIDGTTYKANIPGGTTDPSIIRQVSTIDPVMPATDPSVNCGMNATLAVQVGSASPGSQIQVHWVGSSDGTSHWPHQVGPIMAYMAECVDTTCDKYDSTSAKWFKISELGQVPGTSTWYQTLISQGFWANVTIPANIAPGNYLLRHELISLQNAVSEGGAEFYVTCTQLKIGGNQNGVPPSNDLCTFPGGYHADDSGIYDPNIYNPGATYTFPGPAVAALVAPGSSTPAANSTSTPTAVPSPTATSGGGSSAAGISSPGITATAIGSSASCRITKRSTPTLRRRHLSKSKRHFFLL